MLPENKLSIELIMDVIRMLTTPKEIRLFNLLHDVIQLSKDQAAKRQNLIEKQEQDLKKLETNLAKIETNSDDLSDAVAKLSARVENINNI